MELFSLDFWLISKAIRAEKAKRGIRAEKVKRTIRAFVKETMFNVGKLHTQRSPQSSTSTYMYCLKSNKEDEQGI
jgi:hypothetical protein